MLERYPAYFCNPTGNARRPKQREIQQLNVQVQCQSGVDLLPARLSDV